MWNENETAEGTKLEWKVAVTSSRTRSGSVDREVSIAPTFVALASSRRCTVCRFSTTFEVKASRLIMPGILFAGATLVALFGVVLPLFMSYVFGGQITLYLSSPYSFKDIPDQTGTLTTPHLYMLRGLVCICNGILIAQRSLLPYEFQPDEKSYD